MCIYIRDICGRANAEPNFNDPGVGIQQRYEENKRSNKKVISPSAEPKKLFLGKKLFFWVQRWVKLNQSLNQINIR